jgi:CRISPR/Cas system-associated exonuclease Cas4 (RecB family)
MDIEKELNSVLTDKNLAEEENHTRGKGVFYASEAMQCPRKIYLNITNPVGQSFPLGLFASAKACETIIYNLLKETHPNLETQTRIDVPFEGYTIHGYSDILLRDDDDSISWIGEIKSTANIKPKIKENKPTITHRAQLHCYLNYLDCAVGSVIYVERGDILKVKQFDEKPDPEFLEEILMNYNKISEALETGEAPEPVPVEKWECRYCIRHENCKLERANKACDHSK